MAAKKSKWSVYNDSDKVLDRMFDGGREMPAAKPGRSEPANSNTFLTRMDANGTKGKKASRKRGK
jgi:hypothetical protein